MTKALVSAALLLAIGIYAADMPRLRDGLWTIHTKLTQNPPGKNGDTTITLCRNTAYDSRVRAITMPRQKCSPTVDKSSGAMKRYETECRAGTLEFRAIESMELVGDTVSHMVTESTFTSAGSGRLIVVSDMTYVSACPAGMKPGDALMPDGTINHLPIP